MARACDECGAAIPWGAPQCVDCGAYTHWRSWLATLGITIGGGTVLAVIAAIAWVSLRPPPEALRRSAEVQHFLEALEDGPERGLVAGAGRCKAEIADALCVQLTPAAAELKPGELRQHLAQLRSTWLAAAEIGPKTIAFVGPDGELLEPDRD